MRNFGSNDRFDKQFDETFAMGKRNIKLVAAVGIFASLVSVGVLGVLVWAVVKFLNRH